MNKRQIRKAYKVRLKTNRGGKWFASIQVEQSIEIGRHPSDSEIGIDAGIACFAAFSDGTMEEPGSNIRAKSGLNKSILDQDWYEFRRQLEYKLLWQGGSLVEVDYRGTSQTCSYCGHRAKENRKSQSDFVCLACGYEENADVNAAKNILTAGLAGMVCGSNHISGRKQNPVRARVSKPAENREEVLPVAS